MHSNLPGLSPWPNIILIRPIKCEMTPFKVVDKIQKQNVFRNRFFTQHFIAPYYCGTLHVGKYYLICCVTTKRYQRRECIYCFKLRIRIRRVLEIPKILIHNSNLNPNARVLFFSTGSFTALVKGPVLYENLNLQHTLHSCNATECEFDIQTKRIHSTLKSLVGQTFQNAFISTIIQRRIKPG